MKTYLAIDIGTSSGRHIIAWLADGKIETREVYRFPNGGEMKNGHLCWDIEGLEHHVVAGLKAAKAQGYEPAYIGIDTWGVDFVLLDKDHLRVGDAVAYRNTRTDGMDTELPAPVTSEIALNAGFSNEGGYNGTTRFLKNIMGMWMLQCIHKEIDKAHSFAEMADMAAASTYPAWVDATDNRFMAPANMLEEVKSALKDAGAPEPADLSDVLRAVTMGPAALTSPWPPARRWRSSTRQCGPITACSPPAPTSTSPSA